MARIGPGRAKTSASCGQQRSDREGRDDAEEHRDPAEARRRPGVHVALADLRVQPVLWLSL